MVRGISHVLLEAMIGDQLLNDVGGILASCGDVYHDVLRLY